MFPVIRTPSSITYYCQNAFPINIVASPLAYGTAQLIKTTVVFKIDNFFVDRTSRAGSVLAISDRPTKNLRDPGIISSPQLFSNTLIKPTNETPEKVSTNSRILNGDEFMGTPVENINKGFYNANMSRE